MQVPPTPAQQAMALLKEYDAIDLIRMAIASGGRQRAPIAELANMTLEEAEVGRILLRAEPTRRHYNPLGTVHGGYAGILLDSAMSTAVQTTLKKGFTYTTLEYKVQLVRTMTEQTSPLFCEGKVVHVGSRMGTAEGRITDSGGKLYAHGTATCIIMPL